MADKMDRGNGDCRQISAVLFFGGLWGFTEATLGFLLHLLPRMTGIPPMAGLVLFPIGVGFMLCAVSRTGSPSSAVLVALVAAAIKASSVVLAPVTWVFVQNPVISILLEGLVVWLAVGLFSFGVRTRWVPVQAFAAAAGWRGLFVLAHIFLGLRWGLMQRGGGAVAQFLLLDSLINAVLITLMVYAGTPRRVADRTGSWLRPVPVGLVLVGAVAAEHTLSLL